MGEESAGTRLDHIAIREKSSNTTRKSESSCREFAAPPGLRRTRPPERLRGRDISEAVFVRNALIRRDKHSHPQPPRGGPRQPRASPWGFEAPKAPSPERAAQRAHQGDAQR